MKIFGKEIALRKKRIAESLSPAQTSGGGWFNALFPFMVSEANPGDWQRNICLSMECLLGNPIVFSCITLIASDISKLRPMLVAWDEKKQIYAETTSNAFSPVINKPNHYQNRIDFFTQWQLSLLAFGNAYILKVRDNRAVVTEMYVLDPRRVVALVSTTGEVFYQLSQDNLSELEAQVIVPATEIIHDKINPLFHPLIGLSPLFGCGLAATQGIEIARNSTRFFRKGATPSGIISIPGMVDKAKADKIKEAWASGFTGANAGAVAVLADGAKFEQMTMTSVDSELISQMNMSNEMVCSAFHVPGYMVGVGTPPAYNNIEALNQQYYSQCLQALIEKMELCLTLGLGMDTAKPQPYSVTFDLTQLLRMDTAARYKAATDAIGGGWMTPNEARRAENLPPVVGGDTAYLQQQNYSLAALDKRDKLPNPFVIDKPTQTETPSSSGPPEDANASPDKEANERILKLEHDAELSRQETAAREAKVAFTKALRAALAEKRKEETDV